MIDSLIFFNSMHFLEKERKTKFIVYGLLDELTSIGVKGDEKIGRDLLDKR